MTWNTVEKQWIWRFKIAQIIKRGTRSQNQQLCLQETPVATNIRQTLKSGSHKRTYGKNVSNKNYGISMGTCGTICK